MIVILLVYVGIIGLLVMADRWLSYKTAERDYKAAEERFRRRMIDYSSMPNRQVLAQIRGVK